MIVNISWIIFKAIKGALKIYYINHNGEGHHNEYHLIIVKANMVHHCIISKNIDTIDKTDFETNFKDTATKVDSVDDGIAKGYNDL